MSTFTTRDGVGVCHEDWAAGSPWCSATAGRSPPTHGIRGCRRWPMPGTGSSRTTGGARSVLPALGGDDLDVYASDPVGLIEHRLPASPKLGARRSCVGVLARVAW